MPKPGKPSKFPSFLLLIPVRSVTSARTLGKGEALGCSESGNEEGRAERKQASKWEQQQSQALERLDTCAKRDFKDSQMELGCLRHSSGQNSNSFIKRVDSAKCSRPTYIPSCDRIFRSRSVEIRRN